jgi:hypothetical protein
MILKRGLCPDCARPTFHFFKKLSGSPDLHFFSTQNCPDWWIYQCHWPVALNPNGNHPMTPTCPDGKRDVLHDWKLQDTWKQMEVVLEKGQQIVSLVPLHIMGCAQIISRKSQIDWCVKFFTRKTRGNYSNSRNRSCCQPGK